MTDEHRTIDRRPEWADKLDALWRLTQERDVHALSASPLKPSAPPEPDPSSEGNPAHD